MSETVPVQPPMCFPPAHEKKILVLILFTILFAKIITLKLKSLEIRTCLIF